MRAKYIDGKPYNLLEICPNCVTTEDHFRFDMRQILEDYTRVLSPEKIRSVLSNLVKETSRLKPYSMEQICPKCNGMRQNMEYHVGYAHQMLGDMPGPRCAVEDLIDSEEEHLHYYCGCGNQWLGQPADCDGS